MHDAHTAENRQRHHLTRHRRPGSHRSAPWSASVAAGTGKRPRSRPTGRRWTCPSGSADIDRGRSGGPSPGPRRPGRGLPAPPHTPATERRVGQFNHCPTTSALRHRRDPTGARRHSGHAPAGYPAVEPPPTSQDGDGQHGPDSERGSGPARPRPRTKPDPARRRTLPVPVPRGHEFAASKPPSRGSGGIAGPLPTAPTATGTRFSKPSRRPTVSD